MSSIWIVLALLLGYFIIRGVANVFSGPSKADSEAAKTAEMRSQLRDPVGTAERRQDVWYPSTVDPDAPEPADKPEHGSDLISEPKVTDAVTHEVHKTVSLNTLPPLAYDEDSGLWLPLDGELPEYQPAVAALKKAELLQLHAENKAALAMAAALLANKN